MLILAGVIMFTLASCSSMESDAKKLAKMHYELEQTGNSVGSRSNVYTQKAKEVFAFEMKTWEKYSKDPKSKEEFAKLVEQELNELKNK